MCTTDDPSESDAIIRAFETQSYITSNIQEIFKEYLSLILSLIEIIYLINCWDIMSLTSINNTFASLLTS